MNGIVYLSIIAIAAGLATFLARRLWKVEAVTLLIYSVALALLIGVGVVTKDYLWAVTVSCVVGFAGMLCCAPNGKGK